MQAFGSVSIDSFQYLFAVQFQSRHKRPRSRRNRRPGEATTAEGGEFRFDPSTSKFVAGPGFEQVVRFTRSGYQPTTRVVTVGIPIEVVLQKYDGTSSTWTPPSCSTTKDMMVGGLMAFKLPKASKVARGQDIDYSIVSVGFKGNSLLLGWGPTWSWGLPVQPSLKEFPKLMSVILDFILTSQ